MLIRKKVQLFAFFLFHLCYSTNFFVTLRTKLSNMITKLRLRNWKSFKDSTIYIDPLTFLIGTNASGKSNVVDAFSFLHKLFSVNYTLNDAVGSIRGGGDWIVRRGENSFMLDITVEEKGKELTFSVEVEKQDIGFVYKSRIIRLPGVGLVYDDSSPEDMKDGFPIQLFPESWNIVAEQLRRVFVLNPIPDLMRGYSQKAKELKADGSNIAGVIAAMKDEEKKMLEETLTKYIRPLPEKDIQKVEAVTVGLNNQDAMLYCYEAWNPNQPIDARGMSDGTLRFAAIVVALLTTAPGGLLIVEEVDNGLHPSRAKELVKVLKEISLQRHVDVLCTTHNPILIDELGNEMLPFISDVKRDAEGNSVIELLENKENLAKLMASGSVGDIMTRNLL